MNYRGFDISIFLSNENDRYGYILKFNDKSEAARKESLVGKRVINQDCMFKTVETVMIDITESIDYLLDVRPEEKAWEDDNYDEEGI